MTRLLVTIVAVAGVDLAAKTLVPTLGVETHPNPDLSLGLVRLDGPSLPVLALAAATVFTFGHATWLWATRRLPTAPLGLLIGGAAANLLDRVDDGAVTDWLPVGNVALNLADVAVWLGLLAYLSGLVRERPPDAAPADPAPPGAAPADAALALRPAPAPTPASEVGPTTGG